MTKDPTLYEGFETHPAYGMVAFNRVSGSPGKMFGSKIPQHGQYVRLVIKRGQRKHDHGDMLKGMGLSLIEVWLSSAQFAELLTTMNIGDGVPCTLARIAGKSVECMPQDEETESDRTYAAARDKMRGFAGELRGKVDAIRAKLEAKGTIKVATRKEIAQLLDRIMMEVSSNMPFLLRCYQEAVEKVSTQAKAELDAMVSKVITDKGLEALGIDPKQLTEADA